MSNVDTGRYYWAPGCPQDRPQIPSTNASGVLFSQDNPFNEPLSPIITLTHGQAILVDAYQVPDDKKIFLNRLVIGTRPVGSLSQGELPNPSKVLRAGSLMYQKRMLYGGPEKWVISKTHNMLFITIPGTYQFELEDAAMLDEFMYVEFNRYAVTDPIPRELWGGIL